MDEKIEFMLVCKWKKNNFCILDECINELCDLYSIDYDVNAIHQKIKDEQEWIRKNKDDKTKKAEITDKVMGIKVMLSAIRKIKRID